MIIPVVDEIIFGGGKHDINDVAVPEYDRSLSRNGPAAYSVGDISIEASMKFWHSTALTESSNVTVSGDAVGSSITGWGPNNGTFGTTWPSGSLNVTGWKPFTATIQVERYTNTWKYKCPTGTDALITTTTQPHVIFETRTTPLSAEPKKCYELSCTYCTGKVPSITNSQVGDYMMIGFARDYVYSGSNCAYMSADYTHLLGVQGVTATQEKWSVEGGLCTDGEVYTMKDGAYEWVFHWWVYAGGKTRDPSAKVSHIGDWGAYEDACLDDYRRWDASSSALVWHGSNPAGHATETNTTWKMKHTNPGVASHFRGPPTP